MLRTRTLLAIALVPFLATSLAAQTATKPMSKSRAAKAECFRQAQAAAQSAVAMLLLIPLLPPKGTRLGRTRITHASAKRASVERASRHASVLI
jgi:hypothetical protein